MKTVYIILAFCAGLFLGHLLFPTEHELDPPIADAVKQTHGKVSKVDSVMFESKVKFLVENDSLKKQLSISNGLLSFHRSLLLSERNKVNELTNRLAQSVTSKSDSVLVDSLSIQLSTLNTKTDSLVSCYDIRDSLMQTMIAIRDTQIEICDRSYQETKDLLLEQSKREQQLTENLNVALKQLKRKRMQNRILAGGMLFVSGIVTTLYIKSRQ